MAKLQRPDVKYKESYISYLKECRKYQDLPHTDIIDWWQSLAKRDVERIENNFASYVENLLDYKNGQKAQRFATNFYEYWIIEDGKFIGEVDIRPELDAANSTTGHIGFVIHPDWAGRGLPVMLLPQILQILQSFKLKRVLLTCKPENKPSERMCRFMVQKFGGVTENKLFEGELFDKLCKVRRFWVNVPQ